MTQSIDDASIRKLAVELTKAIQQSGLIPQSGYHERKPTLSKTNTNPIHKTDLDEHFDALMRSNEEASKLTQSTIESFQDGFKRSENQNRSLIERFYKRIDTTRSNKQLFDNFSKLASTQNKTTFDLTKQTKASSAIFESVLGAFTSQSVLQKELPKAINAEIAKTNSIFARQIMDLNDVDLMKQTIDQLEQINNHQQELAAHSKDLSAINDRIDKKGSIFIRSIEDLDSKADLNKITNSLSQIDEAISTVSKLVKDYDPLIGIESLMQKTNLLSQ